MTEAANAPAEGAHDVGVVGADPVGPAPGEWPEPTGTCQVPDYRG